MGGGLSLGPACATRSASTASSWSPVRGSPERVVEGPLSLPMQVLVRLMISTGHLDAGALCRRQDRAALATSLTSVLRRPGSVTDEVLDVVAREVRLGHDSAAGRQWQLSETRWTRARTVYIRDLPRFPKPVLVLHGTTDTARFRARRRRRRRALADA